MLSGSTGTIDCKPRRGSDKKLKINTDDTHPPRATQTDAYSQNTLPRPARDPISSATVKTKQTKLSKESPPPPYL